MTGHLPRPMDAAAAKGIAHAFLPERALGNRYDYYYTLTKLRTDPLYPGVLQALRPTTAPVLDLGCGLGLLAHALRADGQALPAPHAASGQRFGGPSVAAQPASTV